MRITKHTSWTVAIAFALSALSAAPASALSIDDAGVVGTIWPSSGSGSSEADETDWSNYLLSLGANVVNATADADSDGKLETYNTGPNDYDVTEPLDNAVKTGVVKPNDIPNVAGAEYVLVKYDGPNAGYVLFNVEAYDGGSGNLPETPLGIWGETEGQYWVSHITTFGGTTKVPDGGATLILLGAALSGLGAARRFMKS